MTEENNVTFVLTEKSIKIADKLCKIHPNFSINNIVTILPELINHVEDFKNIDTDEKKDYIVNIIKYIIKNTDGPGDDNLWDPILISLVPSTVDLLIDVSKGNIKLKTKKTLLNCCKK